MEIKRYTNEKEQCIKLWNLCCDSGEVLFKKMNDVWFDNFFIKTTDHTKITLIAYENGEFAGYASGCTKVGEERLYISYIAVLPEYRNKGVAAKLLEELEKALMEANPAGDKFDLIFYNPMSIEWYIPNGLGHDHPCAPGVDIEGKGYGFFKSKGYTDYVLQHSYYLQLKDYVFPEKITKGIERLKEHDIEICFFDKEKHYGFPEFFDNIKNPGWKKAVLANLDKDIVIASHNGMVCGYTGPLSVQESGRGSFHGIGVHTEYRKLGIGTILFAYLCKGLGERGALFMSLYTGSENPARFIYEGAGFSIVRKWSDMRKLINK